MKPTLLDFLVLIFVGVALVVANRYLTLSYEGFLNSCGVYKIGLDKPSCETELRCINGFCKSDIPPPLKPTDLPVFP